MSRAKAVLDCLGAAVYAVGLGWIAYMLGGNR